MGSTNLTTLIAIVAAMLVVTLVVAIVFRNPLRRVIIAIADFIFIVFTILPIPIAITLVVLDAPDKPLVIAAGIGTTVLCCLIAAAFLTLTEIAGNTRRMLAYYEPEAQPAQQYQSPQNYDDYQDTRRR